MSVLVEIRCGAQGGKCGKVVAEIVTNDDGPAVRYRPYRSNRTYVTENPLPDRGAVNIGNCPDHYTIKTPEGGKAQGGLALDVDNLSGALETARTSGTTQNYVWTPYFDG